VILSRIQSETYRLFYQFVRNRQERLSVGNVYPEIVYKADRHGLVYDNCARGLISRKGGSRRRRPDVDVMGEAFFDLPEWMQRVLWDYATMTFEEWQWTMKSLNISRGKLRSMFRDLQDAAVRRGLISEEL